MVTGLVSVAAVTYEYINGGDSRIGLLSSDCYSGMAKMLYRISNKRVNLLHIVSLDFTHAQ